MHPYIRIAHRGASGNAPENTIAAFQLAQEIGVDAVELDLHGTADGEVVAIHDSTLPRTTSLTGNVNQATLATLKSGDAGSWFASEFAGEPVPTLEEALTCIGTDTIAVLEIKDPNITEQVITKIHQTGARARVVIISFHIPVLETLRAVDPGLPTGWLVGKDAREYPPVQLCQQLGHLGCNLLNVHHEVITEAFAYEVRRRGIALWCWTVDDPKRMQVLQALGVQGITSNYPERFAAG